MASKVKKLTQKEVKTVADKLEYASPEGCDQLSSKILEDIANSKQVSVFEQRKELLTLLRNDLYDEFKSLVSSLLGDYVYLYRSTKGRTKYADFQVEWLQHIRAVGENGSMFATSDAQPTQEYESDIIPNSNTHATWAVVYCQAMDALGHISDDTNLIILHTIAGAVYNHQQQKFIRTQCHETAPNTVSLPSDDDALYRMCGAEICRMIKARQKSAKKDEEVCFLKRLTIKAQDKEKIPLPQGIKNLDQTGFLWVPIPQLLPYLREVDTLFQDEINHDKFRLKGDRIFEVGT